MSTSATAWLTLTVGLTLVFLFLVIVYQTRRRVRVIDFYESRKELNEATGGLQHELDTLREGWIMWPAGGTAVSIPLGTLSHIERLILLDPDVGGTDFSRLFVGNEMNVKSTILDLTKRAQAAGVEVRWSTHSYLSIVINDHRSDSASARIELLLPRIESAFRPNVSIKKLGNPKLFDKIVEMYESVWAESKEAPVTASDRVIPPPAATTRPNTGSIAQTDGRLETVVTRGPRLEIRFSPDIEPYKFVEQPHDETHYRMGIYNHGPGTANNLQVWLVRITPRPSAPLFRGDFPYAVRWAAGNTRDNIGYHLNSKSEIHYELLCWWVSSDHRLIVDGIDTKQASSRDARFPIEAGESWRMDYEVSWAGAAPESVSFIVRREGQKIFVSRL